MTDALIVFEEDAVAWIKALSESMRECTLESIKKLAQPPPPSTVKRRGRPVKKTTQEEHQPCFKEPPKPELKALLIEPVPSPSTVKRRGRPPKNAPKPVASPINIQESKVQESITSAPPPQSTRKRGRAVKQVQEEQTAAAITLGEALEDRRLSKKLKPAEAISIETPIKKELVVQIVPSTRKKNMPVATKTPTSISKPTFLQTNIAANQPQPVSKRISTDAWVTVSQEASAIAPSVLATPLPQPVNQQAIAASPLEKVDSWTSKFLKPAPPPPSTIKRSARIAAKVKHIIQEQHVVEESPLTRAKRLDSEFMKREAFFKNFVKGSSGALKQKLESIGKSSDFIRQSELIEKPSLLTNEEKPSEPLIAESVTQEEQKEEAVPQATVSPIVSVAQIAKFKSPIAPVTDGTDIMKETPLLVEMNDYEDELFTSSAAQAVQQVQKKPVVDGAATLRIKERQEKAVEKKKQQLEKAMLAKQPLPIKQPTVQKPTAPSSRNPSDLYQAALLNSAARKQLQQQQQPIKPAPQPVVSQLYKTPMTKELGPKPVTSSATPESLPEIPDSEEENNAKKTNNANIPYWARTPALNAALFNQKLVRPEDIFGQVQPIKLEDFFKDRNFKTASPGWKK